MSPLDVPVGLTLVATLFVFAAWLIWQHRHHRTPAPTRPADSPRAGVGPIPYHCATFGHYFVRRYSDRWRCAKCGSLSDIVPSDLGDGAA